MAVSGLQERIASFLPSPLYQWVTSVLAQIDFPIWNIVISEAKAVRMWRRYVSKLRWQTKMQAGFGALGSWQTLGMRMRDSSRKNALLNPLFPHVPDTADAVCDRWGRILWACVRFRQQTSRMSRCGLTLRALRDLGEERHGALAV